MFGSLYNQAVTQPEPKKQNIEIDYSMMSKEFLMKKLMLFNTLDVHDQINTVKNNLETICKDILNNDISYAPVLRNMRFIDIFSKVINSVPIDYQVQIAVNKLSYDYFTSENPDSEIKEAVSLGVCKVNISSDIKLALFDEVRKYLDANELALEPLKIFPEGIKAAKNVLAHKLTLLNCIDKAKLY